MLSRKSVSPSNNPFLDGGESVDVMPRRSSGRGERRPPAYPSAKEEKERLRERYEETEPSDDDGAVYQDVNSDMPPSYDEVAGSSRAKAGYPQEKTDSASRPARDSERRRRYHHQRAPPPPPEARRRDHDRARLGGDKEVVREREYPRDRERQRELREHYRDSERERDPTRHRDRDSSRPRDYYSDREHAERAHRHRHRSHASSKDKKRNSMAPPPKNVDTIDKMDVTGLFGGSFHHDGPFDACTPHRNKNAKAPPVMAFPADGPNNSIGGAPTKKNAMNEVFGREDLEDDDIYHARPAAAFSKPRTTVFGVSSDPPSVNGSTTTLDALKPGEKNLTPFDPRGRVQAVEGPTTEGLGSTTFLDGAPAPQSAIEEDVRNHARQTRLGVQRKKSLSQRLTGSVQRSGNEQNSVPYRRLSLTRSHSGHLENADDDDDVYLGLPTSQVSRKQSTGTKLMRRVRSMKVGRK